MGEPGASRARDEGTTAAVVIDDEEPMLLLMTTLLRRSGFDVRAFRSAGEALRTLEGGAAGVDVVFTDLHMPEVGGMAVLEKMRESWPEIPVVIMTGDGTTKAAVEAMRLGAYDYLNKPFQQIEDVALVARRATERRRLLARNRSLERTLRADRRFEGVVSESLAMQQVFETVEAAAPTDATVLILGESGTGKELIARALHGRSRRRAGPFLPVNCSALTETLLESELFGHVKGAFSGATTNRAGLFEEANGGTLFLDEIGDVTPRVQVSLLRALQESEIKPVGASNVRKIDTRVVAATNRDLAAAVASKSFREDLYYRLNVILVELPPLRKRPEDIPLLAQHFIDRYAARFERSVRRLEPAALEQLQAYAWPGNVRELENTIQRMVVLARGEEIGLRELPPPLRAALKSPGSARPAASELPYGQAKEEAIARFERDYVTATLMRAGGNVAQAARLAGLDKSNFRRLARRHEVDPDQYRDDD